MKTKKSVFTAMAEFCVRSAQRSGWTQEHAAKVKEALESSMIVGADKESALLLSWHNPDNELPPEGVAVLGKCSPMLNAKYHVVKHVGGYWYSADVNPEAAVPWMDNMLVGWRPIEEIDAPEDAEVVAETKAEADPETVIN